MTEELVYYHVVFTVSRGRPVFLNTEIDGAFKQMVHDIARQKEWSPIELETMPNHVHLLLEKAPWQDLREIVRYVKGVTARRLLLRFDWLRADLNSYHLWNRGFHYERHSDISLEAVRAYIRNQRRAGGLAD